jgi:hypothetical protein
VLGAAIALGRRLELRDAEGRMVPASYVELIEPLRPEDPIAAVLGLREALGGKQAVLRAPPTADGEAGAFPA